MKTKTDAIRQALKELGLRSSGLKTQERAIDIYVDYLIEQYEFEAKKLGVSERQLKILENKYAADLRSRHTRFHTLHKAIVRAFTEGYINYSLVLQIRKREQRKLGLEFDCRTYEGQPGRDMR